MYANIITANHANMTHIVYKELSFFLMGLLFEIHNKLGGSFEEKYYQRAVERKLQESRIKYSKELKADLFLDNDKIGKYFLDFLIEDKVILGLKTVPKLLPIHFGQVKSYLKAKNLKLGILVNLRGAKVQYRRILNSTAAE